MDITSVFVPNQATYSVQLYKNARTTRLYSEHFGQIQLFSNETVIFDDIFSQTTSQIVLHFGGTSLIGVSFDGELESETRKWLEKRKFAIETKGQLTFISPNNNIQVQIAGKSITLGSVWPTYSGLISEYAVNETEKSTLYSTKTGIHSYFHNSFAKEQHNHIILPEETEILAHLAVSSTEKESSELLKILTFGEISPILDQLSKESSVITYGIDQDGIALYLQTETDASLEELAAAAEDAINHQSLTTTSLRLPDQTSVLEIRTEKGSLSSEVSSEGPQTTISLSNNNSDLLNLIKNQGLLYISNRELKISDSEIQIPSSCRSTASYFIRPNSLLSSITEPYPAAHRSGLADFTLLFGQVAISPKRIGYCW